MLRRGATLRVFEAPGVCVLLMTIRGALDGGSTFVLFSSPKIGGRNHDSVATFECDVFSAGIISPLHDAPFLVHTCLRGFGLLLGSSPSLDKMLGGKCSVRLNSSRTTWGASSFRTLITFYRERIGSQTQ